MEKGAEQKTSLRPEVGRCKRNLPAAPPGFITESAVQVVCMRKFVCNPSGCKCTGSPGLLTHLWHSLEALLLPPFSDLNGSVREQQKP